LDFVQSVLFFATKALRRKDYLAGADLDSPNSQLLAPIC